MKEYERKATLEMREMKREMSRRARSCFWYAVGHGALAVLMFAIPKYGRRERLMCLDGWQARGMYKQGIRVLLTHNGVAEPLF